jgi:tRNA-dihydrouridine synthase B
MNGITDHPFRHIQKKYGQPMLVYTEFSSVDAVQTGDRRLFKDFFYDESQRPIIAQIYGRTPENFRRTAILLCQMGFDGIDINMGCPTKSVAMSGSGAGLIRTPLLAQEIIQATRTGVQDWLNGAAARDCADLPKHMIAEAENRYAKLPIEFQQRRPVPVSIKTRIGYDAPEVESWIPTLLEMEPVAIGIHGRTLVQGYAGDADWDEIAKAVSLARGTQTLILGNGDIQSLDDAHRRIQTYGVDGVLIGRASYGNPLVFRPDSAQVMGADQNRLLRVALEHAQIYEQSFSQLERYQFVPMRKHLGWYARGIPAARGLRNDLARSSSLDEARTLLEQYLAYRERWEGVPA